MLGTILNIIYAAWDVFLESSLFILFGFFIAGLLKGFIPDNFIQRHLGRGKAAGIFKASLFGVPIPLCSCGVIPAAAGLREQGASKGAVTSFMISTPETGVDSIAVTYALLDPFMTVIRPVAAFFTAFATGIFVNFLDKKVDADGGNGGASTTVPSILSSSLCASNCNCGSEGLIQSGTPDTPDSEPDKNKHLPFKMAEKALSSKRSYLDRLKKGMVFGFGDLLDDIGPWLLVGIVLAGGITVYISPEFIESYLGDGFLSMVIMIALATPLYVCATASTPIAAALAMKGISPGAALVFLLAGPATNMATITVVSKLLGRKTAFIYVGSIMVCSLALGLLVNYLYIQMGMDISGWVQSVDHGEHGLLHIVAAVLLLGLILKSWVVRFFWTGLFRRAHAKHSLECQGSSHQRGCSHCKCGIH